MRGRLTRVILSLRLDAAIGAEESILRCHEVASACRPCHHYYRLPTRQDNATLIPGRFISARRGRLIREFDVEA